MWHFSWKNKLSKHSSHIPSLDLPKHSGLYETRLENGLKLLVLPHHTPNNRFEAHLEIMSGSTSEMENQQGMAHLVEHVAYMGSVHRQLLAGTGSKTNAYTDFHQTVFFASCPNTMPNTNTPMLPMALDALLDVMKTTVGDERLEMERCAVLSELSMINTLDYRIECHVIKSLHTENIMCKRFPIGKEELIRKWSKNDLQLFHNLHYLPDNAVLYIVGDVNINEVEKTVNSKFSKLKPNRKMANSILASSGDFPPVSMKHLNPHFPPVVHNWASSSDAVTSTLALKYPTVIPSMSTEDIHALACSENPYLGNISDSIQGGNYNGVSLNICYNDMLKSMSFHVLTKTPISPLKTVKDVRKDVLFQIVENAVQTRYTL
jgi:secreted Zn-dependent insulinase-like peptidase